MPIRLRRERVLGVPYYRVNRVGCGGIITKIVLVVLLGVAALVAVANRSWLEGLAINAIYDDRPKIHAGAYFTPGASAVEDGMRQTAVLIDGAPHVRVTSPPRAWRSERKDVKCADHVCTARATKGDFLGAGGMSLVGLLALLLVGYFVWLFLFYDDRDHEGFRRLMHHYWR